MIATVKHFAANNQEVLRDSINANVSDQALHEIYFPAFEAAVKDAHVGSVMCSYNRLNGDYACENGALLTTALRNLWHFAGFVVSDWGATHSTAKAANAGLDLEMPGAADGSSFFGSALKDAVTSGQVPMTRLDGMVRDVLTAMFQVGPVRSSARPAGERDQHERQHRRTPAARHAALPGGHRPAQEPGRSAAAVRCDRKTIAVVGYCRRRRRPVRRRRLRQRDPIRNPGLAAGRHHRSAPERPCQLRQGPRRTAARPAAGRVTRLRPDHRLHRHLLPQHATSPARRSPCATTPRSTSAPAARRVLAARPGRASRCAGRARCRSTRPAPTTSAPESTGTVTLFVNGQQVLTAHQRR